MSARLTRRRFAVSACCGLTGCLGGNSMAVFSDEGPAKRLLPAGQAASAVDLHSHLGRFFMRGATDVTALSSSFAPPFAAVAIAQAKRSGVNAILMAGVADHVLLESGPAGLYARRDYRPGEAYSEYLRQLQLFRQLATSDGVTVALSAADVVLARSRGQLACMFTYEGGDFIEDRLDRVAEAWRDGVRSITLMHYSPNQIGDSQTAPARHNGLSALGRDIVRAMNASGILVDLAHASFAATRDAVEVASRPMMISHSNLRGGGTEHPRLISLQHARLITAAGGVIGCVPAGWGQPAFSDYIDTIVRMVDALGSAHVAIGTDMDYTYNPVMSGYHDWPRVPDALLARGMHAGEVAQVVGGNALRLLQATEVRASAQAQDPQRGWTRRQRSVVI